MSESREWSMDILLFYLKKISAQKTEFSFKKRNKYRLQSYYQENTTFFLHSLVTPMKSKRYLVASSYEVKQLFKKRIGSQNDKINTYIKF